MIPFPERDEGPSGTEPRRRGWLLGLALTVLVVGWAIWGPSVRSPRTSPTEVPGTIEPVPSVGTESEGAVVSRVETSVRVRPGFSGVRPSLEASRLPWLSRIRTNGVLEAERLRDDPAYLRRAVQHDRLKTLIQSPARDTPECAEVVAFVDRHGLPLAATVDLYNIIWATRQHEQRAAAQGISAGQEPDSAVRELEMADFRRRFQRDYDVELGSRLEELLALPIHPTVFMGVPSRAFGSGEPLLSD